MVERLPVRERRRARLADGQQLRNAEGTEVQRCEQVLITVLFFRLEFAWHELQGSIPSPPFSSPALHGQHTEVLEHR